LGLANSLTWSFPADNILDLKSEAIRNVKVDAPIMGNKAVLRKREFTNETSCD